MTTMERPKMLIVGGGFAGIESARKLEKNLSVDEAEIRLVTAVNHQLHLPLLPDVTSGVLTPQAVAVSLCRMLKLTIVVPGGACGIDTETKSVVVLKIDGQETVEHYDYLVLTPAA